MKIILEAIVALIVLTTMVLTYQMYSGTIMAHITGSQSQYNVFIGKVPLLVTVAATLPEQTKGLSGVPSLPMTQGKLFIFNTAAQQGIWMKDMLFPIDILWFDNSLKLIHIEKNVSPSTFPTIFTPPTDARFVIETAANFTSAYNVNLGDTLNLPPQLLPNDIKKALSR